MAKQKKSTKKFQKKHLAATIERRKKIQKVNQDIKKREFKKKENAIRRQLKEEDDREKITDDSEEDEFIDSENKFSNMSVSEFFKSGFDEEDDEKLSDDEEDFEELEVSEDDEHNSEKSEEERIDNENSDPEANSDEMEEEALREMEEQISKFESSSGGPTAITKEMIAQWQDAITKKKSLRSLRRLLLAYRAAAHINEDEDGRQYAYKIESGSIFNKLVVVCLKYVIDVFEHHLPVKQVEGKTKLPSSSPKWESLQGVIKSFLSNTLHLLKELTDNNMIYFAVKESEKAIRYWACFPKLAREYLKILLNFWGTAEDNVRIISFLNIRKLAVTSPSPFLAMALKGIYLSYVRNSKTTNVHTLPSINLMCNMATEIYGLDFNASYQHAFVYIRQLAIHLRNSMTIKSKESYKAVYNWQFIHCLEFWANVLATYCDTQRVAEHGECLLQSLIYPFVQVAAGVIRLIPTAQYFPLRFHVIRLLLPLIQKTGTFIPLAPYLFEVLDSAEMRRKPRPSTAKKLEFETHLKAPKQYIGNKIYQDGIAEQLVELLLEYYACYCLSIAFPELTIPAVVQLKRHIKKSKNVKFNKQLHGLVEKIEQQAKYIERARSQVEYSPKDQSQVHAFLRDVKPEQTPLGQYCRNARKLREQRRKLLETANEESE
ncbi:uncharacterized protein VTP21DRAFT_7173 [Calcarisporiella thermophila]|uniref:uncharacterized protein n=1 Tax=Calcarisporiella thermophila TaxID=911321 RepID=UPI0037442CB0